LNALSLSSELTLHPATLVGNNQHLQVMLEATISLVPSQLDPQLTEGDNAIIPRQTRLQPVRKQLQGCEWQMKDKPAPTQGVVSACPQLW